MKLRNIAYLLIIVIAAVIILIYGRSLMIPFVFALLLWFLVREIRYALNKLPIVKKYVPAWVKNVFISLLMLTTLGLVSKILTANINNLAKSYPEYEPNVELIIEEINQLLGINIIELFKANVGDFNFGSILKSIFNSLTELIGNAFMIIIYALFIFLEEVNFPVKLELMFNKSGQYDKISNVLDKIESSITHYIGLKTLVSLITGVVSYIALAIIGIDSPVFWAFMIFILNYIPTIGSLTATIFPATYCLLQFGEFAPCLIVLFVVGCIQILVGNVLEPKVMGNSLNISSLVTIGALSFWGAIWGVTGMILSIPITVIMVIIFSQFEKTKPLAILLSEKGKI